MIGMYKKDAIFTSTLTPERKLQQKKSFLELKFEVSDPWFAPHFDFDYICHFSSGQF